MPSEVKHPEFLVCARFIVRADTPEDAMRELEEHLVRVNAGTLTGRVELSHIPEDHVQQVVVTQDLRKVKRQ